jgi:hypothetical protein
MKAVHAVVYAVGVLSGAAAGWYYTKKKYESILDEGIQSVKEIYSNRAYVEATPEEVESYVELTREYHPVEDISEPKKTLGVEKPYVITPDEFGEMYDYEMVSLVYYEDQVLADDFGNLIDDVEEMIGFESLTHFGEYEDDSVFVRNDAKMCDFEILKDIRTYEEAMKAAPRSTEG